jgi:hypothetical protein
MRWLGLHSPDDEAIFGLRSSVGLELKLMPERSVAHQVFYSDRVFRWLRPLKGMIYPIYNRLIPPLADSFISVQLGKSAQGNDRPGVVVQEISTCPFPDTQFEFPLPNQISTDITDHANKEAASLIPELRRLIGAMSTSGLQIIERETSNIDISVGLVHNSYFINEDVLNLIVWQIVENSQTVNQSTNVMSGTAYSGWAQEFRDNLRQQLVNCARDT